MAVLHERIKEQRNRKKLSQDKLAKTIGVSQQTVGSWEVGRTSPDTDMIIRLATFFDVSAEYLLGMTNRPDYSTDHYLIDQEIDKTIKSLVKFDGKKPYFSQEVIKGIELESIAMRKEFWDVPFSIDPIEMLRLKEGPLSLEFKDGFLSMLQRVKMNLGKYPWSIPRPFCGAGSVESSLKEDAIEYIQNRISGRNGHPAPQEWKLIPIIGTVRAGPNGIALEEHLANEWTEKSEMPNGATYYWLKVAGDSMTGDGIMPGDLALIREQPDIESGELAVVIVNGEEGTLKRVYKNDGSIILQSSNNAYPPRVFVGTDIEKIKIAGKVKMTKRKY